MSVGYSEGYIVGGRKEDLAQIAKDEKRAECHATTILKSKQLGTLFVDRVTVLSVSKANTLSDAFEVRTQACYFLSLL